MNGFNRPQSNWSDGQPKISTGEGEVPLAPPPSQNLDARTMESDLKSLQETGGQTVKPYTPEPTPKEQVFEPPQVETPPSPPPEIPLPTAVGAAPPPAPLPKKKNKLAPIIIVVTLIIAAAAVGYFVVYPALVPSIIDIDEEISQPPPEPTPLEQEPPAPQLPSTLNLPTINAHVSYFKSPADSTREITFPYVDLNSLREIIGSRTSVAPILEEIIVKNEDGQIIAFSGLMPLFTPNFFNPNTLNYFENDYTLYTYTNNQGTWLGIIAKLRPDADAPAIQNQMSEFQHDPNNRNFFLVNPGAMGVWRDGTIKDRPSSIVDFEHNNATLSYTWFDRFLFLSTNLTSAAEAATRLGF